ncbi:MAG: photosystem II assembly protein Psb35 [Actinomycetota bacterium]
MENLVGNNDLFIPIAVLVAGFVAAVTIGSVAWYNSKRPPGWEQKERPDFVPKIDAKDPTPKA